MSLMKEHPPRFLVRIGISGGCRWFRPRVVYKVLEKGYAVHLTDVDIAYSPFGECLTCRAFS